MSGTFKGIDEDIQNAERLLDVRRQMDDYSGFPVDVADDRLMDINNCGCVDITGQCLLAPDEPGHGCHLRKEFTDADLLRLAGQLERAEEQGWRFERYARCGVGEHRHRWQLTSWLCQIWTYVKGFNNG